jgi:hypothetical protein
MDYEQRDMLTWALDWAISGTLERLGSTIDDVVFLNVIPVDFHPELSRFFHREVSHL